MSELRPGNRHAMLLWAASAANEGASWITLVTVFVYVLRHFPASSLAIVELVGSLPGPLCMPFAGAIADRRDVRRLALGSMTVRALGLLGVLVMLRVGLWEVAACYGLQGAAGAVWPPARQRRLYELVREDRGRAAANAAMGSVSGVMTITGAAVILGSVLAVRLGRGSHLAAYALAYALQGAAWSAMFLGNWPASGAALLAVMRTASGVIIALDTTILLSTVPERLRGRITSLHMTTYGAASRVALAVFAGLLAVTGVRTVGIVAGAASAIFGAAWWWLNGRRARPRYLCATSAADAPGTVSSQTADGKARHL